MIRSRFCVKQLPGWQVWDQFRFPDFIKAYRWVRRINLIIQLQQLEQEAGRVRLRRWGERTLDLDLLIYGQQQIQNERLTVPHIGILERDFVVIPLLDIDTHLQLNGHPLKDLELVQQANLTVIADQSWANA